MMQSDEIRQGFSRAEQSIRHAAAACSSENTISMDLKDSIQSLDQKVDQARGVIQSGDEESVRQCVQDLEQLGDRARDACERDPGAGGDIKQAVMQAHDDLSRLKRELH
jgi:hypothetical protein